MKDLLESIPVPKKVFRDFAIITLCITASIAFLANSGSSETISQELGEQKKLVEMREADAKRQGPVKYDPNKFNRTGGGGFGSEGPVEPEGGGASGAGTGVRMANGNDAVTAAQSYDLGTLRPETIYTRQGKLPPATTGPLWKKPKMPSAEDKAKLMRSAEERAGAPTQAL